MPREAKDAEVMRVAKASKAKASKAKAIIKQCFRRDLAQGPVIVSAVVGDGRGDIVRAAASTVISGVVGYGRGEMDGPDCIIHADAAVPKEQGLEYSSAQWSRGAWAVGR